MSPHKADGQEIGDPVLYLLLTGIVWWTTTMSLIFVIHSEGRLPCKIQNTPPARSPLWSTYPRPDDATEHNSVPRSQGKRPWHGCWVFPSTLWESIWETGPLVPSIEKASRSLQLGVDWHPHEVSLCALFFSSWLAIVQLWVGMRHSIQAHFPLGSAEGSWATECFRPLQVWSWSNGWILTALYSMIWP